MLKKNYQWEMDQVALGEPRLNRLLDVMAEPKRHKTHRPLRAVVTVAAACVVLITTVAAAYLMGAFDFIKEQPNHAALGQNEVYDKYAYEVDSSVTTKEGDVFTVERVAMDGKVCTVFYSIRFQEPMVTEEQMKEYVGDSFPSTWQIAEWDWSTFFTLYADGVPVSGEGYNNSFETQEYLADPYTFYGAWRCLLTRALIDGETVEMEASTYQELPTGGSELKETVRAAFTANPIRSEHIPLDVSFMRQIQADESPIQVVSLDRSPLGAFLTLREERLTNWRGLEFVLRDADTGAYIPYAEVFVSHVGDPEGYRNNIFELFGDVSGLENLELIPTMGIGSISPQKVVSIGDLPSADCGNPAGGYAPASYEAKNGKLIVAMKPVGAANAEYASLGNGVYFLDADGNTLFENIHVRKFKDRSDGTITVVSTPDAASYERDVGKVAQIWFFVQKYNLMTGQTVHIPIQ